MTPSTISTITTISHAPIPPTKIPSEVLQNIPTFDSVFRFEDRLKSLEASFSEYIQTNPFAEAVSNISGIVHQYMNQQMIEAVRVAVQIQTNRLHDSYQRENNEFLRTINENIKRIIKEQVKGQVKEQLKKVLIEKMEGNKSIQRSNEQRNLYNALVDLYNALDSYGETVILKRRRDDDHDDDQDEGPSAGSDRGSKRRREGKEPELASAPLETTTRSAGRSTQTWINELVKQADSRSSFNELLDTPLDFSNFIMNQLRVDTLTPELLAGPTFELMKGSCTSLIELEYHLEEVYKAIIDQLDWVNPEVMKTKAANYGQIKWIEDLVPRKMWIHEPIDYNKHAFWGVSHWGQKRQQFYGFAVNRESALDVYSKRGIIVVMDLKIVEWHSYKHLDWITVRRDDDKLYKFKEGDFKRLRLQDIEDMLLLLVQGTRRVKDLQLRVESYQKRLNLAKPDTYWSDLKRREAYTVYSNPREFIYQNKDKKNRLMRIDKLHKFSDETLNDVRNALTDRLKGIRMQYLPQTI
nr:hypothetical protein [Tanacetum cinerariifolium]